MKQKKIPYNNKEGYVDLFIEECEKCGKVIKSLNKNQCKYNFMIHKIKCDKGNKVILEKMEDIQ